MDEPSGKHGGNWYALFMDSLICGVYGKNWRFPTINIRSGFRLHLGSISDGCITICKFQPNAQADWLKIRKLIDNTDDYFILLYGDKKKKLKVYGYIDVK